MNILHGQCREAGQSSWVREHDFGQCIVMLLAKPRGVAGVDVMKIGQRVGREHLKVDAGRVHIGQPDIGLHKRAALVANTIEAIISHPKPGCSRFGVADLRSVSSGGTHRARQHRVGMNIN